MSSRFFRCKIKVHHQRNSKIYEFSCYQLIPDEWVNKLLGFKFVKEDDSTRIGWVYKGVQS